MKNYREPLAICLLVAVLQSSPLNAATIDVVYPPGAPRIGSDFESYVSISERDRMGPHQGIDIKGANRQPILAVADGTVLEATVEGCWGPTIAVDHGNGPDGKKIIALYGHVGEMLVKAGEQIRRGKVIARLGNNQVSFSCIGDVRHLHFQIGREYRSQSEKSFYSGHSFFLKDGENGVNPHLYWADGAGNITCFEPKRSYRPGSLTYPFPCS